MDLIHFCLSSLSFKLQILFLQKEHYLGLTISNDNWWRTHGIGCTDSEGSGVQQDEDGEADCFLSYAVSNTINYMLAFRLDKSTDSVLRKVFMMEEFCTALGTNVIFVG